MLNDIFQFIAANSRALQAVISSNAADKTHLVIDLEDALQDVLVPQRTAEIKAGGRLTLSQALIQPSFSTTHFKNTGIRINGVRSAEFAKDLVLLAELKHRVHWGFIVLPKVEAKEELAFYKDVFEQQGIGYHELLPVIETVKGFENVSSIFTEPARPQLRRAFWGHHDYNLDAGLWPFVDQDAELYWQLTGQLVTALQAAGYGYINGPFTRFSNSAFIKSALAKVHKLCPAFDQAAVFYDQVKTFVVLRSEIETAAELVPLKTTAGSELEQALETVQTFEKYYAAGRSFSLNLPGQQFISPHQYLCARQFLQKIQAA